MDLWSPLNNPLLDEASVLPSSDGDVLGGRRRRELLRRARPFRMTICMLYDDNIESSVACDPSRSVSGVNAIIKLCGTLIRQVGRLAKLTRFPAATMLKECNPLDDIQMR